MYLFSVLCFLFCLSSNLVPNAASVSGLSIRDCSFGFLKCFIYQTWDDPTFNEVNFVCLFGWFFLVFCLFVCFFILVLCLVPSVVDVSGFWPFLISPSCFFSVFFIFVLCLVPNVVDVSGFWLFVIWRENKKKCIAPSFYKLNCCLQMDTQWRNIFTKIFQRNTQKDTKL